ncbi:hypothetical protein [Vulcanimicrobium alpinum]|uniref:hypothetical protein n=1 Tax=Vulcanimicrobium alpinum TaxID=3016050 RepID=UPI00295EB1A9|nr:hypothetical protein [Vulcanimicrobium alpinum]
MGDDQPQAAEDERESAQGDDACWLHHLCDECGALVSARDGHRPGCTADAAHG